MRSVYSSLSLSLSWSVFRCGIRRGFLVYNYIYRVVGNEWMVRCLGR